MPTPFGALLGDQLAFSDSRHDRPPAVEIRKMWPGLWPQLDFGGFLCRVNLKSELRL